MTPYPAVRWGQPPLTFELQSSDDHLLARASLIFRPWGWQASPEPPRVWRVDPVPGGDTVTWRITGGAGDDAIARESIPAAVRSVEFLAVQDFFEWPSACTLHGALVARNGRGVLLLGRGEAGKSTLACALWQRGWTLLGDDMALVDALASLAWPAPRRVSLRKPSRGLLGAACGSASSPRRPAKRPAKAASSTPGRWMGASAPARCGCPRSSFSVAPRARARTAPGASCPLMRSWHSCRTQISHAA